MLHPSNVEDRIPLLILKLKRTINKSRILMHYKVPQSWVSHWNEHWNSFIDIYSVNWDKSIAYALKEIGIPIDFHPTDVDYYAMTRSGVIPPRELLYFSGYPIKDLNVDYIRKILKSNNQLGPEYVKVLNRELSYRGGGAQCIYEIRSLAKRVINDFESWDELPKEVKELISEGTFTWLKQK